MELHGFKVDDTVCTGTVFCCVSDESVFGNLKLHFVVENFTYCLKLAIFGLFGLLKTSIVCNKTWKCTKSHKLAVFLVCIMI